MSEPVDEDLRIVVALGGNALLKRGERPSAEIQHRNMRAAAGHLAELARAHSLVVTHGNGPQVGLLALQSEIATDDPMPLDVLGAQTQGMIGYMIEDELRDRLGGDREVATLLTQVVVDARDPAFDHPTKPIGPEYSKETAERLARERSWAVAPDGTYWRRVVPSPEPTRILELGALRVLLDAGIVVICAGGGGVPVIADEYGGWRGVDAVVDKDLSAALLADQMDSDVLMLLTDVDGVYRRWGTDEARRIDRASPAELRSLDFAPGTMGPKVEAACRFIEAEKSSGRSSGRRAREAYIGALEESMAILAGDSGTRIAESLLIEKSARG